MLRLAGCAGTRGRQAEAYWQLSDHPINPWDILAAEKRGWALFGCRKTYVRTFRKFDIQSLHFWYIGNLQRSCFVRPEYPSGWSSDLESGGHRFDSWLPEGRFGVTCSSIWECLGMCLGVVWGRLRMDLDGFAKKCWRGRKIHFFQKWPGYFSWVWLLQNSISFAYRHSKYRNFEK